MKKNCKEMRSTEKPLSLSLSPSANSFRKNQVYFSTSQKRKQCEHTQHVCFSEREREGKGNLLFPLGVAVDDGNDLRLTVEYNSEVSHIGGAFLVVEYNVEGATNVVAHDHRELSAFAQVAPIAG